MIPLAKLIPIIEMDEDQEEPRREIIVHANEQITLGRNKTTGIDVLLISKSAVLVEWKDDGVVVAPLKSTHSVRVGSDSLTKETKLEHGSVLSLHNSRFAYKVEYVVTDKEEDMNENIQCPVCLDVLVDAVILNPCGHTFCRSCRDADRNTDVCPTCRTKVQSDTPNRFANNVIWDMVQHGSLSVEETRSYLQKTGRQISELTHGRREEKEKAAEKRKRRKIRMQALNVNKGKRTPVTTAPTSQEIVQID